ncbi:MAG: DUF2971 domain-containing protein [Oscillospiraceae bacterium]|nr:DUF2971 domain-containing protein [Oscillospiraceae bacterium]
MSTYYIRDINFTKEQINDLEQYKFLMSNLTNMPTSLFKYFPNNISKDENGIEHKYSLEALMNNTVYLSPPSDFDDPYDCNIFVNEYEFALQRIRYYASSCGVDVDTKWSYIETAHHLANKIFLHLSSGNSIETLFRLDETNVMDHKNKIIFQLTLKINLVSPQVNEMSLYNTFNEVIQNEIYAIQQTANHFRIACFAQNPYSMLMWAHYARSHKGFCIEYEMPFYSKETEELYHNLYPVIYTDTRTDLTSLCVNVEESGKPSENELWDYYKYGLLSKSLDWKYQQEWRLISFDNLISSDSEYNCNFFKIKKVYLGNKMPLEDRMEIIEICKNNEIPYTGVNISPDRFEMKDCNILCEDCYKIKNIQASAIQT